MTFASIRRKYGKLSAQERFRLIEAATQRDDPVEAEQLSKSGRILDASLRDHQACQMAFQDVSLAAFMEAADLAGVFQQMMLEDERKQRYRLEEWLWEQENAGGEGIDSGEEVNGVDAGDEHQESDCIPCDDDPQFQESQELILAAGFVFRQKVLGWKRFCKRLGLKPFARWKRYPGYERIMRLLEMSKLMAFDRKGILDWLNRNRKGSLKSRRA